MTLVGAVPQGVGQVVFVSQRHPGCILGQDIIPLSRAPSAPIRRGSIAESRATPCAIPSSLPQRVGSLAQIRLSAAAQ
jgi:hypothetical protein